MSELVDCPRCKTWRERRCFLCEQACFKPAPFKIPIALAVEYALTAHVDADWYDRIKAMRKRHNYERKRNGSVS